jgi:uncharacterized protein (TIGR03118 family)
MRTLHTSIKIALLTLAALSFGAASTRAGSFDWENLQSDIAGVAEQVDPNVLNPWGIAQTAAGNIWVADNHAGVATVYKQDGTPAPNAGSPLVVTIPPSPPNTSGSPTGVVFNGSSFFKITKGSNSQPARLIFVSEDGMISGFNSQVDSTNAIAAKDNDGGHVYKGATLGVANGRNFLYVVNFHAPGSIETYNENFVLQSAASFPFVDPSLPADYSPFNIRNFKGQLFVTYAKRNPASPDDDLKGAGLGLIDVFNTNGQFVKRLVSPGGNLNAPWGLEIVSGSLWVGNFGDGQINVYNPNNGNFQGKPRDGFGNPLAFDGLWGLLLTNNGLFFTAGIADEDHGIFGVIFSED